MFYRIRKFTPSTLPKKKGKVNWARVKEIIEDEIRAYIPEEGASKTETIDINGKSNVILSLRGKTAKEIITLMRKVPDGYRLEHPGWRSATQLVFTRSRQITEKEIKKMIDDEFKAVKNKIALMKKKKIQNSPNRKARRRRQVNSLKVKKAELEDQIRKLESI
jgi:hypothetical protein